MAEVVRVKESDSSAYMYIKDGFTFQQKDYSRFLYFSRNWDYLVCLSCVHDAAISQASNCRMLKGGFVHRG